MQIHGNPTVILLNTPLCALIEAKILGSLSTATTKQLETLVGKWLKSEQRRKNRSCRSCKSVWDGKKDILFEICGNRYCMINKDKSTRFTTRLVSNGGVYSANDGTLEENDGLLEKAGMLEHDNCIPYLFKSRVCNTKQMQNWKIKSFRC